MFSRKWGKKSNKLDIPVDYEVSSIGPSEAGTEVEVRRRIKYGRPAQAAWGLFSEYANNSTIHGVRYLGERKRPLSERIWWIIVFALSLYFCGKLILNIYEKWDQSPVIVSFAEKSTPVWQIPFPAVTICPETKTKMKSLNFTQGYNANMERIDYNITEEEMIKLETIAHVCDPHLFLLKPIGENFTSSDCVTKLREMAPSFDEMLMYCKWRNFPSTCDDLFSEILTEEGVCYTFNVLSSNEVFRINNIQSNYSYLNSTRMSTDWTLESGYQGKEEEPYPVRVLGAGAKAGLNVLLRLYEYDLDYICRGPVQGFKILLHTPGEIPQVSKQYFRIPLNEEVVVSVRPNMITTSDGLKHYTPSKRQCFFNEERQLKFFQTYTQANCELECLANFTLKECGCVKFSMPREENTLICGAKNIDCYTIAEDKLLKQEFQEGLKSSEGTHRGETSCNCLPACTSIAYEAELSQADFDWKSLFIAYQNPLDEFPGIQMARLTIFFKETQFITSKRSELYGQTDFLANCGGLLGLFMGVSILSLVELVYFCTIRLMCNLGMRKRKQKKMADAPQVITPEMIISKENELKESKEPKKE